MAARLTSPFGWRVHPVTGKWKLHQGIDLAMPVGTPIQAIGPGAVAKVGTDPTAPGGLSVTLEHPGGWRTYHGHLAGWMVRPGDQVAAGQVIGLVGMTGRTTGPHLHFGLYSPAGEPVDPLPFLPPGSVDYG